MELSKPISWRTIKTKIYFIQKIGKKIYKCGTTLTTMWSERSSTSFAQNSKYFCPNVCLSTSNFSCFFSRHWLNNRKDISSQSVKTKPKTPLKLVIPYGYCSKWGKGAWKVLFSVCVCLLLPSARWNWWPSWLSDICFLVFHIRKVEVRKM